MSREPANGAHPEWGEFFQRAELRFHEEYHLWMTGQKPVRLLPEDALSRGSGWFLTFADQRAGEWNLAKCFGFPGEYAPLLGDFPAGQEFHLLVPEEEICQFIQLSGLEPVSRILCLQFDRAGLDHSAEPAAPLNPGGYEIRWREENPEHPFGAGLEGYLLAGETILGFIKNTHATPGTMEIYIEVRPSHQGKGLGTHLLTECARLLRHRGRSLVYLVEEENPASRRIAAKAGLVPYQTLARFLKP